MASKTITVTSASVVTGDTLASYNAYTDKPSSKTLIGTMTPAEALAGKSFTLADGLNHNVTVYPVGTTTGEFNQPSNIVVVDLSSNPITDVSTMSLSGKTADLSAQISAKILSVFVSNDGLRMWVTGSFQFIYEYSLSVAGDISTTTFVASHDTTAMPGISSAANITSFHFNNDGTKFYVSIITNNALYEINLSTPYDLSSFGTGANVVPSPTLTNARQVNIDVTSGLKMIALGNNNTLRDITSATGWDILGFTTVVNNLDLTSTDADIKSSAVNPTGDIIFFIGRTVDRIWQVNLTTPWDLSTAQPVTLFAPISSEQYVHISADGSSLYTTDSITLNGIITEYKQ